MKRAPYRLTLESRVSGTPRTYTFETADGVRSKQSFREAELLLLESLWGADLGRLLCPEANYGVVGTVLSGTADAVRMTESSARATRLCERNVRRNDADASVSLCAELPSLERRFDAVAYAPKPYAALPVGKRRIAHSLSVLRPGGRLYVAASKRAGLARYEDWLGELADAVERVAASGGHRLLEATRPRRFDAPPCVSPQWIRPTVDGIDLSLATLPGLFAASGLDDGTRLLLETVAVQDGERVLDLCCGYGAVGAYAGRVADCDLWLSDDDRVATRCAERSLRASGVDGNVVTADCIEGVADRSFDRVLCNPPTHAGGGVLSELFDGVHGVLAPDGRLDVVHHRELDVRPYLDRFDGGERCAVGAEHVVLRAVR